VALNELVPDDVALAATSDGSIRIVAGEGFGWARVASDLSVADFALAVLATLQDEVIEFATKTGWPPADASRPNAPQSGRDLPEPHAQIVGEELHCWYGSRRNPALRVPPITLRPRQVG
jgi:hypothetical protein